MDIPGRVRAMVVAVETASGTSGLGVEGWGLGAVAPNPKPQTLNQHIGTHMDYSALALCSALAAFCSPPMPKPPFKN